MPEVRNATLSDAQDILNIYAYYVEHTAISFEYDVPTLEEFRERMRCTLQRYPYLVAVEHDKILGYTYAGPFVGRKAYKKSSELTIYLDKDVRKHGIGRMLYEEIEARLKAMGIHNLYACIGDPIVEDEYLTRNSEKFHEHLGFVKVGEFHKCGYKFNRWYNMIWMEKLIVEDKKVETPVKYMKKVEYKTNKYFEESQLKELFQSVGWLSADYSGRLVTALAHSDAVISAWDGEKLVGLVNAIDDGELTAYAHYLLVNPEYQNQGIGGELLKRLKETYEGYLYLILTAENDELLPFYERMGFHVVEGAVPMVLQTL